MDRHLLQQQQTFASSSLRNTTDALNLVASASRYVPIGLGPGSEFLSEIINTLNQTSQTRNLVVQMSRQVITLMGRISILIEYHSQEAPDYFKNSLRIMLMLLDQAIHEISRANSMNTLQFILYHRRISRQFLQLTQSIDEKLDVLLLDGLAMNSERIQALGRVSAVRVISRRDDGVRRLYRDEVRFTNKLKIRGLIEVVCEDEKRVARQYTSAEEWERDLKRYQNIQHRNVLQLFGASDEHIPSPFILFQSTMQAIDLQEVAIELHRRGDYARFFAVELRVLLDISSAVKYLQANGFLRSETLLRCALKREYLGIADTGHLVLAGVLGPTRAWKELTLGELRRPYTTQNIVSFCGDIFESFIQLIWGPRRKRSITNQSSIPEGQSPVSIESILRYLDVSFWARNLPGRMPVFQEHCLDDFISALPYSVASILAPAFSPEPYRDKLLALFSVRRAIDDDNNDDSLSACYDTVSEACRRAEEGKILLAFAESSSRLRSTGIVHRENMDSLGYWSHFSKTEMQDHNGHPVTRRTYHEAENVEVNMLAAFGHTHHVFVRSIPPGSVSADVFAALSYIADVHDIPTERLLLKYVEEPRFYAEYRTPEPAFEDEPRTDVHLFIPHDSAMAPYWSGRLVPGARCLIERTWGFTFEIAILPARRVRVPSELSELMGWKDLL